MGMLNAIGLANVGLDRFLSEKLPRASALGCPLIGSIAGHSVEDYLAVEGVHYEGRLRVSSHIDPAARDALLPPMALQLLVENAIKHGIAVTPGGGELQIVAKRTPDALRLTVENPGYLGKSRAGHGVGLAYLRQGLVRVAGRFVLEQHGPTVRATLEIPQ